MTVNTALNPRVRGIHFFHRRIEQNTNSQDPPTGIPIILTLCTEISGGRDRARTGDPLLAKQVLSQLSYTPSSLYRLPVYVKRMHPSKIWSNELHRQFSHVVVFMWSQLETAMAVTSRRVDCMAVPFKVKAS